MNWVEFDVGGERYRVELHGDVLIMRQRCGRGWEEIARLTVAAASVLAALGPTAEQR